MFSGTIGETSGTCTIKMNPKKKRVKIMYNGINEFEVTGYYHSTYQNAQMFDTKFTDNLKLYCGGNPISPKSVKKMTNTDSGYSFEGYQYLFDVRIENDTCELR